VGLGFGVQGLDLRVGISGLIGLKESGVYIAGSGC
jgi:hypothetical protein